MKLTREEEEYTRQVAAEIGRDPDDLIAEGERIKEDGYRERAEMAADISQAAASGWTERSHAAAGGLGMRGGSEMSGPGRREPGRAADREAGE